MTREEAEKLVHEYRTACRKANTGPMYDRIRYWRLRTDNLEKQLIAALCADPNAELLEACKRLYDIAFCLTVREVIELGDDAIAAIGLNPTVSMGIWQDSAERINLDWAKAAIAAAKEG